VRRLNLPEWIHEVSKNSYVNAAELRLMLENAPSSATLETWMKSVGFPAPSVNVRRGQWSAVRQWRVADVIAFARKAGRRAPHE